MNDIIQKQNERYFIELLKAQRISYSQSKQYIIFDYVSISCAIILPVIGILNSDLINIFGAFGVLWTIIYLIAESFRKNKTEQGAKIQEQFDTELYNLSWNKVLCRESINRDIIYDLAEKYESDDLENWYSIKINSSLPKNIAILLCQRINFSWEFSLRKKYDRLVIFTIIIYYGTFLTISIINNIGIFNLLTLLAPTLPFLIYGFKNFQALKNQIKSKNESISIIDNYLFVYQTNKIEPTESILRQIQDSIYVERKAPEKIPNWFYNLFKNKNENKTDNMISSIISKF